MTRKSVPIKLPSEVDYLLFSVEGRNGGGLFICGPKEWLIVSFGHSIELCVEFFNLPQSVSAKVVLEEAFNSPLVATDLGELLVSQWDCTQLHQGNF